MRITPRSEWKAAPPTKVSKMPDSRYGWIVHYNGPPVPVQMSGQQLMQSVQRYHQATKGWRDFAYSFGIDQDGNIFEGRGWFVVGGHTSGRFLGTGLSNNSHAHAVIFLIGQGQAPSQAALDAFAWLVAEGAKKGVPVRTTPHKVAAPELGTSCPGAELTAITKSGYFLDTNIEEGIAMREIVRQLYINILGREPDEEGWDYWTGLLDEQATTIDLMQGEFLKVRFAAVDAAIEAIVKKIDQPTPGGPSAEVLTVQAFDRFLDDLAAFAKDAKA